GLELLPDHRFEIATCGHCAAGFRRGLAKRVGILARDSVEAAICGYLDRERSAERLSDEGLEAFFEHDLVARRDLHALALAGQFNAFHGDLPSLSAPQFYRDWLCGAICRADLSFAANCSV